ncbi:hypothetical protein [Desulforapulum autotrophicum]|nr:hypothetical protein [Desulforapulum autotrophicum]
MEFLDGIDALYFQYIAEQNVNNLDDDENKHKAAISLRVAYSQSLETLFALLCSAVQSPQCTVGWMLNYKNSELIRIIKKISKKEFVYSRLKEKYVSWFNISKAIHHYFGNDSQKKDMIIKGYGSLWARFASEYTDSAFSYEYNSIKHGLRVNPGGFQLAVGHEDIPGNPAAPEKMINLGGSDFGSSFFVKEKITGTPKHNFRPRRYSRNWDPIHIANRLSLISMSINNVVNWLKLINGKKPERCKFLNPENLNHLDEPWDKFSGPSSISMDLNIDKANINTATKDEIIKSYKREEA